MLVVTSFRAGLDATVSVAPSDDTDSHDVDVDAPQLVICGIDICGRQDEFESVWYKSDFPWNR